MSYFIDPVEEEQCVFLNDEGELSLVEAEAACQEVGELLSAKRWNRILVDVTGLRSIPKGEELFDLGRTLSRIAPPSVRIALVVKPDQTEHAKLIEAAARNRGTFLTLFVNVEEAEAWVRGEISRKRRALFQTTKHLESDPLGIGQGSAGASVREGTGCGKEHSLSAGGQTTPVVESQVA